MSFVMFSECGQWIKDGEENFFVPTHVSWVALAVMSYGVGVSESGCVSESDGGSRKVLEWGSD